MFPIPRDEMGLVNNVHEFWQIVQEQRSPESLKQWFGDHYSRTLQIVHEQCLLESLKHWFGENYSQNLEECSRRVLTRKPKKSLVRK